jgi:SAM-dependent methyltransferase
VSLIKPAIKDALNKLGYDIRRTSPKEAKIKLLDCVSRELQKIEKLADNLTRSEALKKLRALSLGDFGLLMLSIPNPDFPKLSAVLPRMAKEEVQIGWTGTAGVDLLTQTIDFVRSLAYNFTRATGRPFEHANILDFGCGYGWIMRMMYCFSGEDQVYGVDPWDISIETCRADGLTQNFSMSEYLQSTLPIPPRHSDLVCAFSVFTHLSERATFPSLNTISDYLKPDGLIAITIRPVEYWDMDTQARRLNLIDQQKEKHNQQGFSFLPHGRPPVDGDIRYGDTSVSLDWLKGSFPKLKIAAVDRLLSDPYQMYIFLRKRSAGNQK